MPTPKKASTISSDELTQLDLLRANRRVHRKHVLAKPPAAPEHFLAPALTAGQRLADRVASTIGSWRFIAIQSSAIMMSQNRQSELDRRHAETDYEINVKAELEIELLHEKMDLMKEQELLALTEAVHSLSAQLDALLQRAPGATIADSTPSPQ